MESCKFLIFRLSAVGDVIRTMPAVKALKESFPFSHITWVVEEPSVSLLASQPGLTRSFSFLGRDGSGDQVDQRDLEGPSGRWEISSQPSKAEVRRGPRFPRDLKERTPFLSLGGSQEDRV